MVNRIKTRCQRFTARSRLAACTLLFFCSQLATAHPHSWIEMKTHIEARDGMISGFYMEWSFDAMTSAFMLEGENSSSPEKLRKAMDELTVTVMENMHNQHYFTHFYDGKKSIDFKPAFDGKFSRNRARLVLTFHLPLFKPQPLTKDSLKLQIFEPSYYVDMNWPAKQSVTLSDELAKQCSVELILPNPTPQQMSYALSLPKDADPDNSLGELFTQSIRLNCTTNANKPGKEVSK